MILATSNAHKTAEFQAMLGEHECVRDLSIFPELGEIVEDAESFEGNADIKALAVSALTDEMVIADDSGLCVSALGGAPGIRSARYAGNSASMEENKALLLQNLADVTDRSAYFVCALSVARKGVIIQRFRGECHGYLLREESGVGGFGYDPMFVPEGEKKSFAELPAAVKNEMSHRAHALMAFQKWFRGVRDAG